MNKRGLIRLSRKVRKAAPTILMGIGVITAGGAVASAVVQTMKCDEILKEYDLDKEKIQLCREADGQEDEDGNTIVYTEQDAEEDKKYMTRKFVIALIKNYWPTALLFGVSLASFLSGYGILRKRYTAVFTAFTGLTEAFQRYRGRVVDKYGKDVDQELYYGDLKELMIVDGGDREIMKAVDLPKDAKGPIDFWFGDDNVDFCENQAAYNVLHVKDQEDCIRRLIDERGIVTLNDIRNLFRRGDLVDAVGYHTVYIEGVNDSAVDLGLYTRPNLYNTDHAPEFDMRNVKAPEILIAPQGMLVLTDEQIDAYLKRDKSKKLNGR